MTSSATWLLQRVYGITFPDQAAMKEYQHRMEEAKKRDHRAIGTQQELFFFDRMSPGSCFFMPNGTRIYNTLVEVGVATPPGPFVPASSTSPILPHSCVPVFTAWMMWRRACVVR